jgi:alkaline phosphatase D
MSLSKQRRDFLIKSLVATASVTTGASLAGCSDDSSESPAPTAPPQPTANFMFGVASGDPLVDRVMLWTHAQFPGSSVTVTLQWQVATDSTFTNIVASGTVDATAAAGFTAKVDATGLTAGTTYVYRFIEPSGVASTMGTTRTLPTANATSVKFAVFSCTLYSEGFFNAYDAVSKSDALYALHVGDYIYEYGSGPTEFGNEDAVALNRVEQPANDTVSLDDYRTRYRLHRSDPTLQTLHAKMPWITVWDDHEFANNAFMTGAENHNPATQGDWITRKTVAAQAYHEWLPIRTPDPTNLLKIYRTFDFGSLFSLHMIDTRIEGRVQQYAHFGDPSGVPNYQYADYIAGLTPVNGVPPDAARTMISPTQQAWLTGVLTASRATWQVIGNQDIMARIWFPSSILNAQAVAAASPTAANVQAITTAINAFLGAKAARAAGATLTPTQTALLSTTTNPRLPYNLDSWDGYPINRETVLQTVKALNKKLVVLSGDSHNAWFTNLTTLANEKVGVEFAGTSVTSPGFESAGLGGVASAIDGSALGPTAIGAGLGLVDDVSYSETQHRGFLMMTVTAAAVTGQYVFVDTVKSTTYTASVARTVTVAASGGITFA